MFNTIVIQSWYQDNAQSWAKKESFLISTFFKNFNTIIIGASLSEPHIDHDNVPRRGECLYLSIYISVLRKPWIWDNPWIVLRKAWIGRYPQFAQDNPWIAPRRAVKRKPHLREVRPGAAEILSRLCLFVNSENSQLAKWCGLYSLSLALSAMEVRWPSAGN